MSRYFIDFSQHNAWMKCPWYWYEQYIAQVKKSYPTVQRDDALALGLLVHAGLETLKTHGTPSIPEAAIIEATPTPECLGSARMLVNGYQQAYPAETFTKYYCEEPLRFPLLPEMDGLAKIDSYFRVDEPTRIADGLEGEFWLQPGWWIHEYKTKDGSAKIGNWVAQWRVNMQASFQVMALQAHLQEPVQGILINVLEKPKAYIPKRTCKGCKEPHELRNWVPTGEGYSCPGCGNVQKLDISDKSTTPRVARYYRHMVTRSEMDLAYAHRDIIGVAMEMLKLHQPEAKLDTNPNLTRTTRNCVDSIWGQCVYFDPHTANRVATGWPDFISVDALGYINK